MKRAFIAIFAALLAVAASAITATKEYVDRKDADKRGITDLTVYGEDVAKPYALADECRPIEVTVNGTTYNLEKISLEWSEEYDSVWVAADTGKLGDFYGDAMRIVFRDGVAVALNTQWDDSPQWKLEYRFGGKPFKAGEWPRLKTEISPTADQLATTSTVAQVARSVVNTVWDEELGVAWEARMHNGQLYYVAVTNQPPEVK